MSRTIRRKHGKNAGDHHKGYWATPIENLKMEHGVLYIKVGWAVGWLVEVNLNYGTQFRSAEHYARYQSARYHSDVLCNHPADTYLKRLLNKRYRKKSNHSLKKAIREMEEDNLSLLSKKMISGWLD